MSDAVPMVMLVIFLESDSQDGDTGSRSEDAAPDAGIFWGKSDAAGSVHLLIAHLLDTAAVAELLWDRFLAPSVRDRIDACADGRGRLLLSLICGLHDCGKATPAFQSKVPALAQRVRDAGLGWSVMTGADARTWHHAKAGAFVLRWVLPEAGWDRNAVGWVWPLVAGHHGTVPASRAVASPPARGDAQGLGGWRQAQSQLVRRVAAELGCDLGAVIPPGRPSRSTQLAMSGVVIMADWIASDDRHFPGIASPGGVSIGRARERAMSAWAQLGLRGGWNQEFLAGSGVVRRRFGISPRPAQDAVVRMAERMSGPGLIVVEAPMGEGKTEAALAAAEVLARRFGADGIFVGMPTQATSDPMYSRVRKWLASVDPDVPVALLHGKRQFNREWSELRNRVRFRGVGAGLDEYGLPDPYATPARPAGRAQGHGPGGDVPAEWFLGRKRGLLAPVTVGTVDQLLHAATRTRHVMLRHAGLAGRVVILDEVHAYDVYMSQFLFEALRWLADAGVPVIVLSATLPPATRDRLIRAYCQGVLQRRDVTAPPVSGEAGYPQVTAAWRDDGGVLAESAAARTWRAPSRVAVAVLDERPRGDPAAVADAVCEAAADGGCVLVIRNTVGRAQQAYLELRGRLGGDVMLLHSRLTVGERADRTARALRMLGPPGDGTQQRPRRLVIVATQIAEQAFDVDCDFLVSDLAPIDLLLQRAGRLHRHERPAAARPGLLAEPRLLVTGLDRRGALPGFPAGSTAIYGDYLLLCAAALAGDAAASGGWFLPQDVPGLVERGYGDDTIVPADWTPAADAARMAWLRDQAARAERAAGFLLAGEDALGSETLAGLHERATADLGDEDAVAAVVRDGDPSAEVVLVRRDETGYLTLDGSPLGPDGDATSDPAVLERVLRSAVRLPPRPEMTSAAQAALGPFPAWDGDPWLRHSRVLVLDGTGSASLGGWRLTYDTELGLITRREG